MKFTNRPVLLEIVPQKNSTKFARSDSGSPSFSQPASITKPSWNSWNQNHRKQTSWVRHAIIQFLSLATAFLARQTALLFLRFMLHVSPSIYCSPSHVFRERPPPNIPFLDFFLMPRVIHSTKLNSCLFPKFRNLSTLRDFPLALSAHFGLLPVYGGLRDAQKWHRAVLTGSPCWTEITNVEIRCFYALTKHITWRKYY